MLIRDGMIEKKPKETKRGGVRPNSGRKAGSPNKKTQEVIDAVEATGCTPLEYLLSVMRNDLAEPRERLNAAVSAAPYVHAKLASIEVSGKDGAAIDHSLTISFVGK